MALVLKYNLNGYQYGTDIKKGKLLYRMSGKLIYEGKWITKMNENIITVEMNQDISQREAEFYLKLNNHRNIIQTFGYVDSTPDLTIFIQEYARFNDLGSVFLNNHFRLSQAILLEIFIQIADAMIYVAKQRIVHGDLGCRNVLVFRLDENDPKNNQVKLTDLGLARWMDRPLTNEENEVIPIRFCAPEILKDKRHESFTEKSDVYSFAVFIWEALSHGEQPFSSINEDEDVRDGKIANNISLNKPTECHRQLWNLMQECWNNDRERRPTFERIANKLSKIDVSDDTNLRDSILSQESLASSIVCKYKLNRDVRKVKLLEDYFSETYEAEWINDDGNGQSIVLVKVKHEPSEYEMKVYNECQPHPHIVETLGFVEDHDGSIFRLEERARFGNLQYLLRSGKFQPTAQVLKAIFLQIVNTMIYLLQQDIVHCDLRCSNILVSEMHPTDPNRNRVQLSNFSLAYRKTPSEDDDRRVPFSIRHCAPEIFCVAGRTNYTESSEIYSMGVLIWEACSKGIDPYGLCETSNEVRERRIKKEKLPKPAYYQHYFWPIMEECWHVNPEIRDTFERMQQCLSQINFTFTEQYTYVLDRDITKKRRLVGKFYEADWINRRNPPVVLLILDENDDYQARFYLRFNDANNSIIQTFGTIQNNERLIMLAQERANCGDLQRLLQQGDFHPSISVLKHIFLQIIKGMICLSNQNIVHGDLRCMNILVFQVNENEPTKNIVKITNFNMSGCKNQLIPFDNLPMDYVQYCAYDILLNAQQTIYSESIDVYSMGILMWQAYSKGQKPYGNALNEDDIQQLRLNTERLVQPKRCPQPIWTIIQYCWLRESSIRFTFYQIETQLKKIDLSIYDTNHDAKPQPSISSIPHFTRCRYCGERCLGSEIKMHEDECRPPRPPSPPIKPIAPVIRYIQCKYCMRDFRESEISNHERTCRQVECRFCNRRYRLNEIDNHEKSCQPPRKPPIRQEPLHHIACQHCKQQILISSIDNHERSCPLKPKPIPTRQCIHCHQQYSMNNIAVHERSCPARKKSCMDYLRSIFFCCSNDND